jgi:hypothetical protein
MQKTIFAQGAFLGSCSELIAQSNYNEMMARGWESKSVEAQQAEASDKSAKHDPPMSAEEAARWREKESLRLARQSVVQQLEASTNPLHRKLLQDSLADLEEKLRTTSDFGPQTSGTTHKSEV